MKTALWIIGSVLALILIIWGYKMYMAKKNMTQKQVEAAAETPAVVQDTTGDIPVVATA